MRRSVFLLPLFLLVPAAALAEVRYTAMALRDPFSEQNEEKPVDETLEAEQRLRTMTVQGIVLSAKNTRAIISGSIYRVGSPLDKGAITKIGREGVTVTVRDKDILLSPTKGEESNELPSTSPST